MAHLLRTAPAWRTAALQATPARNIARPTVIRAMHTSPIWRKHEDDPGPRMSALPAFPPLSEYDPQLGDYPNVRAESRQTRRHDPRYFDTQAKRHFGEPLHEQDDILGVWAPDIHEHINPRHALRNLLLALCVLPLVAGGVYLTQHESPAHRKEFPRNGLFEETGSSQYTQAPYYGFYEKLAIGGDEGKDEEEEE